MKVGEILVDAWNLIWKYKVLLLFGFITSCTSMAGKNDDDWGFVLTTIILVIATCGMIGMVLGAWQADEGIENLSFRRLLDDSLHYFWQVIFAMFVLAIG